MDNEIIQKQYISTNIGDMCAIFSGPFPLRKTLEFEDTESHLHSHLHFEIQYVIKGSFQLKTSKTYTIVPNDVLLIPPNLPHATSKSTMQRLILDFSFYKTEGYSYGFSEYQYYHLLLNSLCEPVIFHSPTATHCFTSLLGLYDNEFSVHKQKILLSMLFLQMIEQITPPDFIHTDKPLSGIIEQDEGKKWLIENHINRHYTTQDSISLLCTQLNLSRRQTDRTVSRLFGESYQSLIQKKRMHEAKLLIQQSSMPLSEVAEKVGYTSYPGFYLAFKNFYNQPPDQLRNPS